MQRYSQGLPTHAPTSTTVFTLRSQGCYLFSASHPRREKQPSRRPLTEHDAIIPLSSSTGTAPTGIHPTPLQELVLSQKLRWTSPVWIEQFKVTLEVVLPQPLEPHMRQPTAGILHSAPTYLKTTHFQ